MPFCKFVSTHKTLRGEKGPKTGMFAIFGQVLKSPKESPKTGILTNGRKLHGGKSPKVAFLQSVENFE